MTDLDVLLARVLKMQAEREADGIADKGTPKDKWRERGFDAGLLWVEGEILAMLIDRSRKEQK